MSQPNENDPGQRAATSAEEPGMRRLIRRGGTGPLPWLLALDLDGTLVGDAEALAALNHALAPARPRVRLAYVTGRRLDSALGLITRDRLLLPDVLITSVGTAIARGPAWSPDPTWESRIRPGWDADAIDAAARAVPGLRLQPAEALSPYKRSFYLTTAAPDGGAADPDGAMSEGNQAIAPIAALSKHLAHLGIPARLVFSSNRDLDVIPAVAGKGAAVQFVAEQLGIALARVVACGDSGNDTDMLAVAGKAALVANAHPDLVAVAPPGAYQATRPFAAGVHEALIQFGVLAGALA